MRHIGLMRLIGPMSLIGLMSCLGLMGCSSDSGEQEPAPAPIGTAIAFSAQQGEEQKVAGARATRAGTPLSEAGVTRFTVWGYKNMSYDEGTGYGDLQTVFPGYTVNWYANSAATTTTNTNNWEYVLPAPSEQTIKYWDWSAKVYRFFGVTGTKWEAGDWLLGQYKTNATSGAYEISLKADASGDDADEVADNIATTPYFSHLWFSTGKYPDYADKQFGKPVTLEFLKPLTRVRFIFKYVYPREGVILGSKSFKPTTVGGKIARKGTVTISYPLKGKTEKETFATTVDTSSGYLTAFTVDSDLEDDAKDYVTLSSGQMTSDGWYIVAANKSQGSYTLSVTINNDAKTAVVPAEYMSWLPGYSYTYIFKITQEGGVEIGWVEYAVTPWTDLEADHMVYNW